MRILILSQFYEPEPIPKPHELAVALVARGHRVRVITGFPNYPHGTLYPRYKLRPWKWESRDGVSIIRIPLVPDHSRSSVRRVLNYGSFMASAGLLGPMTTASADVMYVWHPPLTVGVAAWIIGMARRIPFVYGVHDLWPEAIAATGMVKSERVLRLLGRLERFVYRRASTIAVVSPGFKRNLESKGVPPEKVHVLPDWADESIYRPVPPSDSLAEETGMARRFNVLFGGNMGLAQALHSVVDAAQILSQVPDIQFVFAGDGVDRVRLENMVNERGIGNVRFLGRQPPEQMPHLYALSDVLLAHFKRDPLFEISIPGKVFAYMACQRPVLMASEGDAAEIVRSAGAGMTCPAEDPEALAGSVLSLYHMDPQSRARMGESGRRAFLQQYSRDILVRRHEELLHQVAQGPMGTPQEANRT